MNGNNIASKIERAMIEGIIAVDRTKQREKKRGWLEDAVSVWFFSGDKGNKVNETSFIRWSYEYNSRFIDYFNIVHFEICGPYSNGNRMDRNRAKEQKIIQHPNWIS